MSPRTPRTAFAAILLALLVTLMPATPVEAQTVPRYQNQARAVTNDKRAAHDLVKLRPGRCVQRFARRHARRMADRERMYHQDLGPILNRCNLSRVGENVAFGYPTGRRVVRAWMSSPGHRANILEPRYRLLGLAMRRSDNGTPYAVQVFGRR
jgi:uncharacterized protein YkwD